MVRAEKELDYQISVVIPAYNEVSNLDFCVQSVERTLKGLADSYEIILAEDGSTDGTKHLAAKISEKNMSVRHIHSDKKLGRGKALKAAFKQARGRIVIYTDADLPADLAALSSLIEATENGFSIAAGSRHLKGSRVKRPISRWLASMVYNLSVRILFGDGVRDHQCGFKAFRKESLDRILDQSRSDGWFWDTEIIVKSHGMGHKIAEIPVQWRENRQNGESKVRLLDDSLYFAKNLSRLWIDLYLRHNGI